MFFELLQTTGVAFGLYAIDRFDFGYDVLALLFRLLLRLFRRSEILLLRLEIEVVVC